jgi:DNA-binding NarL/FixJ family response regulator
MAQGATNRQIAEELTLTEGTVKLHVHNILKKLEVDGRTAAVSLALQTGLVKL